MKAYLVHAHPEEGSFTSSMRDVIADALSTSGWSVRIQDLYRAGFNPVLSRTDFLFPADPERFSFTAEQRAGYASGSLAPDILQEVEALLEADLLVLTFPVYWFSMPAILKGWIDRAFLSGPLYTGREMYSRGKMRGRRALVAASLGGQEHMFGSQAVHGPLHEGMMSHLLRGTLGVVGYDVVQPFWAYHAPYVDEGARADLLAGLRRHVERLDEAPILAMPDLEQYDRRFRPLADS